MEKRGTSIVRNLEDIYQLGSSSTFYDWQIKQIKFGVNQNKNWMEN